MIKKIVGMLIRALAFIANKTPTEWLVSIAGSAQLTEEEYMNLQKAVIESDGGTAEGYK